MRFLSFLISALVLAFSMPALAAGTAPAFTTAAVANFSVATGGSFTIAVDGVPPPVLAIVSGVLPPGLGFSDNHDGTATLSGTPAAGSGGSYPLAVSATNSAGTAVQHLSLTVGGAWVTTRAPSDLRYNGEPYDVSYNGNTRQLFPTQGTLNGLVNPNNDTCTVSFDYGPTTAYGSTLVYGDVSGAAPVAVSTHANFSWIHDYFYDPVLHYRTKAVCATSGTWHGNDITFVPFTSTVRWYTDLGGPGPANASYPTLSIHVFATCLDDPTWANFDILNSSGLDVTVVYGPGTYDRVIIGDWQTQQVFFAKGSIPAFSYNYTLFNQTVTNDQSCAETPSPPTKIRAYALGLADTLAASGAEVFAIYNDNPAPVTLEVMAVADVFNVTLPARSRQLIATGMGEMQLSHDATPFQVISPHSIFWADRYLVTALPVCTTATTNAFMLSNNGAAPQTAVLRSGSTEHRYDLAAYESRQVTVESGSWDLYLVVPGMAGPGMVGDHLKVATLASGGGTCGRTLTVEGNQSGGGYVTAAGCTLAWNGSSGSCSVADGASITLSSHPGSNGTFLGWSAGLGAAAACSGTADCTFTMHGDARLGWGISLDTSAPAYQNAALNAGLNVATLGFDEALANNLADLATLKAAVSFAADGTTFGALAAGDTVALSGSTLVVTFATPLNGNANKIRIAADSLKDAGGNVLAGTVTTAALNAVSVVAFTAPTSSGSGAATVTVTNGGAGCAFASNAFVPLSAVAAAPPAGVIFPQGLLNFALNGCTTGNTITVGVVYPTALPTGTQYWKYGPTPGNATPHWYTIPATIAGNTVTYTITDGGLGDDDLLANGSIADPGGPGAPGAGVSDIPTLSEWVLLLLSLLLGAASLRAANRKSRRW